MNWLYLVTAVDRPRVQSRIMQILDHQRISPLSFTSVKKGEEIRMRISIETDSLQGTRITELIRRLEDIRAVKAFQTECGVTRTAALSKIACEHSAQLSLMDILTAIGTTVLLVNPSCIAFKAAGNEREIADLYHSLQPYWPIEAQSSGAAALHTSEARYGTNES